MSGLPVKQKVLAYITRCRTQLQVRRYLGAFRWLHPDGSAVHERHVFHLTPASELPEEWEHVVSDGVEDKGLRFRYFWIGAAEAAARLSGGQGAYLVHL